MTDEQGLVERLRGCAKTMRHYGAASIEAPELDKAADTLEAQSAQIAELQATIEHERNNPDVGLWRFWNEKARKQQVQITELREQRDQWKRAAEAAGEDAEAAEAQISDLKRALDTARHDAMEEAARVCAVKAEKAWHDYKRGDGPERGDPHYQGMSDGADDCERLIRALQTKDQSHDV